MFSEKILRNSSIYTYSITPYQKSQENFFGNLLTKFDFYRKIFQAE